jgi:hypothetical protein
LLHQQTTQASNSNYSQSIRCASTNPECGNPAARKNKKAARHTPNRLVKARSLIYGCSRRSVLRRMNADKAPVPPSVRKLHDSGNQREQRVVFALSDADACLMLGAALPNQDSARVHELTAKPLYSESLSV